MENKLKAVAVIVGTGAAMAAGAWLFQRWVYPFIPTLIR